MADVTKFGSHIFSKAKETFITEIPTIPAMFGSTFCVIHIVSYSRSDAEFHTKILHDIKCHTGSETKCHTHDI